VDLFLAYRDLTVEARLKVWEGFIERAGRDRFDVDVDAERLAQLAKIKLNGREIKNLVKSAHLLCLKGGEKITFDKLHMLAQTRVVALEAIQDFSGSN